MLYALAPNSGFSDIDCLTSFVRSNSISVLHDAWVIGQSLDTHIATVESYEERPPWGTVTWKEEFAANGAEQQDVALTLQPGFTDDDCANGLASHGWYSHSQTHLNVFHS